jgi:hypothetical protein
VSGVGSRTIGVSLRPMSPENTTVRVASPSVTRSSMIAEPRIWPASWKMAVTPSVTATSST